MICDNNNLICTHDLNPLVCDYKWLLSYYIHGNIYIGNIPCLKIELCISFEQIRNWNISAPNLANWNIGSLLTRLASVWKERTVWKIFSLLVPVRIIFFKFGYLHCFIIYVLRLFLQKYKNRHFIADSSSKLRSSFELVLYFWFI